MNKITGLIAVAALVLLPGCSAATYLGNTKASVSAANGFSYESNKNQEGLKASGKLGADGLVEFTVETTATTPEAAIAAALATNLKALELLDKALAAGLAAQTRGAVVPSTTVPTVPTVPSVPVVPSVPTARR